MKLEELTTKLSSTHMRLMKTYVLPAMLGKLIVKYKLDVNSMDTKEIIYKHFSNSDVYDIIGGEDSENISIITKTLDSWDNGVGNISGDEVMARMSVKYIQRKIKRMILKKAKVSDFTQAIEYLTT